MNNQYHEGGRTKIIHPWTSASLALLYQVAHYVRREGDVLHPEPDKAKATHQIVDLPTRSLFILRKLRRARLADSTTKRPPTRPPKMFAKEFQARFGMTPKTYGELPGH